MAAVAAQVFAQPIFETAEKWITEGKYRIAQRPALMRAVVRCSYVSITCLVAILIPFFGDLMGCAWQMRTPVKQGAPSWTGVVWTVGRNLKVYNAPVQAGGIDGADAANVPDTTGALAEGGSNTLRPCLPRLVDIC